MSRTAKTPASWAAKTRTTLLYPATVALSWGLLLALPASTIPDSPATSPTSSSTTVLISPPTLSLTPAPTPSPLPSTGFRLPAEFEPIQGVVCTWGISSDLKLFVISIIEQVVRVSDVYIFVDDARQEAEARSTLQDLSSLDFTHVHFIHHDCDSIWHRNYGAFGIIKPDGTLGFLDACSSRHWRVADDQVPLALAHYLNVDCYEWPFLLDGGNLMTDGQGTVFYTTKIYEWNHPSWGTGIAELSKQQISQLITAYTGHHNHVVLPYQNNPFDGTGHLNMFAKIITPRKILTGRSPAGGYNHSVLEAAYNILSLSTNARGGAFEVITLPTETNSRQHDLQYANSLMVNGTRGKMVLVPVYNIPADQLALQIYRTHLPDYEVVAIDSSQVISKNGTINCVTQTIPLALTQK